jgi:hypothetical protein
MKKVLAAVFMVVTVSHVISSNAFASLTIDGNSVYDDVSKQYWVRDLGLFTNETYSQQLQSINQLNVVKYNGQSRWHLAKTTEVVSLFSNSNLINYFLPTYYSYDSSGNMYGPGAAFPQTSLTTLPGIWAEPFKTVSELYGRYDDTYSQVLNGVRYSSVRRYAGEASAVSYITWPEGNVEACTIYPDRNAVISGYGTNQGNYVTDDLNDPILGAWVTTSTAPSQIPTAPTPIPAAAWLLGSGLLSLVGFRRTNTLIIKKPNSNSGYL